MFILPIIPKFPVSDNKDVSLPPGRERVPLTWDISLLLSGGKSKVVQVDRVTFLLLMFSQTPSI